MRVKTLAPIVIAMIVGAYFGYQKYSKDAAKEAMKDCMIKMSILKAHTGDPQYQTTKCLK